MPGEATFNDGSTVLQPLSDAVGVSVDKVNFVLCIFAAMPLSYLYRKLFPPGTTSRQIRSLVPLLIGFGFCYFCFGRAVKHLLANCLISYALMYFSPPKQVHKTVFAFSMGYLLIIHFYRWVFLTSYLLDITGPIMVAVQKITSLGFSLYDGKGRKKEDLNETQKKEAISEVPTLLEFMSFVLNFQTVLTGPVNIYADYVDFLDGKNIPDAKLVKNRANPTMISLRKFAESLIYLFLIVKFGGVYVPEVIAQPEYLALPYIQWLLWWFTVIFLIRVNYYFAWTFADAVCNMSGFGFSGVDKDGNEKWELCTNVKPYQVEMAQSFKETLDGWNIQTGGWLRRVAYERSPKSIRTIATYVLSATWHGISVGYYITFMGGALFTLAGATFRRCMRWRFVDNPVHKQIYDFVTFMATKITLAYCTYHFVTMNLQPGLMVYTRVFFAVHIAGFLVLYGLPRFFRPLKKATEVQSDGKTTQEITENGKRKTA